jgi:hypothetical protein
LRKDGFFDTTNLVGFRYTARRLLMYTAVVLETHARNKLGESLNSLPQWSGRESYVWFTQTGELCHHCTLNLGKIDEGLNEKSLLGELVELTVDAFCWDNNRGVCAARVTELILYNTDIVVKSKNAQPHVTICVFSGTKPAESNNLDWSKAVLLDEPLTLHGVVEEC